MNAPLPKYTIQQLRPGAFLVLNRWGHSLGMRETLEAAEARVVELEAQDVVFAEQRKAQERFELHWPLSRSTRDEEASDGAQEGNDGWAAARVPRERFDK